MIAGTVLQVAGQYASNIMQAQAELRNAEMYREQSEFAYSAMLREMDITERNYNAQFGRQVSVAAGGGADVGSGSIVNTLSQTLANKLSEVAAIQKKGRLDAKLAFLRGGQAQETASTLSSAGYNAVQAGGTLLTNIAKYSDG